MSLNQLAENKNEKKAGQVSSFSICRVPCLGLGDWVDYD